MKNLIKMPEYVLENHGIKDPIFYAKFITQTLELGMFVPCDEDGNVLEEPKENFGYKLQGKLNYAIAKERCLFEENFSVIDRKTYKIVKLNNNNIWVSWNKSKTIEDLIPYNLELTENNL